MKIVQKRAYTEEMNIVPEDMGNRAVRIDSEAVSLPQEQTPSFLHYHNGMEVGICTEGMGIFYGRHFVENIEVGDVVVFLPGHAHYSRSIEGCRCRFAYIHIESLLTDVFRKESEVLKQMEKACAYRVPAVIRKAEYPQIYGVLHGLLTDLFSEKAPDSMLTALQVGEFLLKIPGYFAKDGNRIAPDMSVPENIIGAVEAFISSHYHENITASRLCSICYLSESQLRRRFKKEYGMSPMQYVRNLRCRIASRLLLYTDLSVSEIAERVGYEEPSVFYRQFTACYGKSPSEFRKK